MEILASGLAFVLTLASGVWLSRSGKPLKTGIFNVHKLIALAAVVLAAMQMYNRLKNTAAQPLLIALLFLGSLCVVALFLTGAFMSMDKPGYARLLLVHRVSLVVMLLLWPTILLLLAGELA
jgi:hypothetical protein